MSACAADGCGSPALSRGLCNAHYKAGRKSGVLPPLREQPSADVRFMAKVDRAGECWLWTGALTGGGYGQFRLNGSAVYAHRASLELFVGPIPAGLDVDHLCRTPACVNPDHLEPVTHRENVLRGVSPAAQQARMTICGKGLHSLADAYVSGGKRRCRPCNREWQRNRARASQRSAA